MARMLLLIMSVLAIAASALALPAAGRPPRVGSSVFVVGQDARLCPSPLCGGYWVRLANRSRTRCSDGALRSRCYVARAVDEERHPLSEPIRDGSLARAEIEPWRFDGVGELGVLVVARSFAPVGARAASGRYLRVVDTGIRCFRAPCFSLRAAVLNREQRITLSGIDVEAAADLRGRIEAALASKTGVLARGRVVQSADGGRALDATRFYLPSER